MKLKLPKAPETVTDQILLCFVLIVLGLSSGMLSLSLQEKPIPAELKEMAKDITLGVFAAIAAKKLTL